MDIITIIIAASAITGALGYLAGKARVAVVMQERDDALGALTATKAALTRLTDRDERGRFVRREV